MTTENLISFVICRGATRMTAKAVIAISNNESKADTILHRMICMQWSVRVSDAPKDLKLTCPLHFECSNLVDAPQPMFSPSMAASVQVPTKVSNPLQSNLAVLLSLEKRRFMKKMTEHLERAFEMMNRHTLAIAHCIVVSQSGQVDRWYEDNIPCQHRLGRLQT